MILSQEHAKSIKRVRQNYTTRQDKIRLGMNEHIPSMPEELFQEILKDFTKEIASSYPEIEQSYDALSKFLSQPRDRLLITSGADVAIKTVLETFCKHDDEIVTISPTFAMYAIHTALLGCILREVYCNDKGEASIDSLLSLLKVGVRAVIIANPNGVSGFIFSISDISKLAQKAEEKNILVIIDETYADFGDIDISGLIENFSNLIIIRSFSKNIGMAGLRIGYILTSEYLAEMIEKFKPMVEINSLAVKAIVAICSNKKYLNNAVEIIVNSRYNFANNLRKLGFEVIVGGGNFVLVDFENNRDIICNNLEKNNIEYRVLPSPLKKYIRITVGANNIMDYVIKIISKSLK